MSQAGVKIANTHMVRAELQRDWSLPTGGVSARRRPNFGYIFQPLRHHGVGK